MLRLPTENFRSPVAVSLFALTAAIGLALDLWTKSLAETHLSASSSNVQFIPGWLHFEYTENRGAVFGLGQGRQMFFVLVSACAIVFLIYLFATSAGQRLYQFVLGMLMAGVLGNMYDRIVYGHVRDMIHALPRWPNLFPWIFNVADSLLCVGVALMFIYSILAAPKEPQASPRQQAADA